jgi:phosphate:Na+ symporter
MQSKKEIDYMFSLVEENMNLCFDSMENGTLTNGETIAANEEVIDFTNSALTKFLVKLSATVEQSDETVIGSYFHVLNDLERVGDHAENFYEIVVGMKSKGIAFSDKAKADIKAMSEKTMQMLTISKDAFDNLNKEQLPTLAALEDEIDEMKRKLTATHFSRLTEGDCSIEVSPYYSSTIVGLERVADHLVNIGYSIVNPTGSQKSEA